MTIPVVNPRTGEVDDPSRMGDHGLTRFFRTHALIRQTGTALPIAAYAENAAG